MNRTTEIQIAGKNDGKVEKISDVYAKWNEMDFLNGMKGEIKDEVKKLYESEHRELVK